MDAIPVGSLLGLLFILVILSGFFSSAETALMALNRYRLRHLVEKGHRGATRADQLLQQPDRLIGLILLFNNAVNLSAAPLASFIGFRLYGQAGAFAATPILIIIILIFAEVAPKTFAALHPERIAFPAAYVLTPLLKVFSILVQLVNLVSNGLLRLMGAPRGKTLDNTLSQDELRTVVREAGGMIPDAHQDMLISILDLEKVTVEDIMIPRNEINAIDLDDDWEDILEQLINSQHTRLPIFQGTLDKVIGFTHLRKLLKSFADGSLTKEHLTSNIRAPYFIPENTPLNKQLLNFQKEKRRTALAVDEYGDIQGLVTMEDILEEIVGEFTTDPAAMHQDIFPQEDGNYLINASITVRELRRALNWKLPLDGPKTLNGLILEHMEDIPKTGTSLLLAGRPVEIMQTQQNSVKTIKLDQRHLPAKPDTAA